MASNFVEKFHDPVINRRIFFQRVSAFIVDYLKPYKVLGIESQEHLHKLQNTIEMDVYKYAYSSNVWTERELPLRVKLQYHKGKMHIDLGGPLGGEIYVEMMEYLNFSRSIGPVGESREANLADADEDDDDDETPGGFRYGRQ